jgi:hypothetical protein
MLQTNVTLTVHLPDPSNQACPDSSLDVAVKEAAVEVRADGVVDEALLPLGLGPSLILEHDIIIPPSLDLHAPLCFLRVKLCKVQSVTMCVCTALQTMNRQGLQTSCRSAWTCTCDRLARPNSQQLPPDAHLKRRIIVKPQLLPQDRVVLNHLVSLLLLCSCCSFCCLLGFLCSLFCPARKHCVLKTSHLGKRQYRDVRAASQASLLDT